MSTSLVSTCTRASLSLSLSLSLPSLPSCTNIPSCLLLSPPQGAAARTNFPLAEYDVRVRPTRVFVCLNVGVCNNCCLPSMPSLV